VFLAKSIVFDFAKLYFLSEKNWDNKNVSAKKKIQLTKNSRSLLALMTSSDCTRSLRRPAKSKIVKLGIGKKRLKINGQSRDTFASTISEDVLFAKLHAAQAFVL
jgi:hypothetical protein